MFKEIIFISQLTISPPSEDFCKDLVEIYNWANRNITIIDNLSKNYPNHIKENLKMKGKTYKMIKDLVARRYYLFRCNK